MGSITEGILGGLQIAQQRKRDENTQKSQELAQTFAILQSLQHNQDRLNDLEQESAQLQTTRFQAVADEAVKQRAMTLAKQGATDPTEVDLAAAQFQAAQGARQALDQRIAALMSQKDTVRGQNAALSDFMSKYALLKDIAGLKQQAIPAAMQPIPMPQQGQQPGGMESQKEDFLNPPLPKSPSGQQAQPAQAGGQPIRPEAVPAPVPMNAEQAKANPLAFQLDLIKRKVDPGATIENGQIVIHAATTDDARRLDRTLQEVKASLPFTTSATVIDDEGVQNRAAQREDRQAMAKKREMDVSEFEAKDALSTAEPKLRDVGIAVTQDQSGATRLAGPGGAGASLVEMTPDPKDPTKMTVQGASQEKAADALEAAAESAGKNPQAAKAVVRDLGQGINAYVEDLASHGDVQRKGRTNEYVVNLFGRDPDQAQRIMGAINDIAAKAKTKDLPKLVLPDPGAAVFQYSQYATTNQRRPPEGEGRATASGMTDEGQGPRNDVEKLLSYLNAFAQPTGALNPKSVNEATLSPQDSRRVVSAFDHPGGYNLLHFKGEGKDRLLKSRLMELIHPSQRGALEDAIRRIP
jgi:hypothetical protein